MEGSLESFRSVLGEVGWFIPPYVSLGILEIACQKIKDRNNDPHQEELIEILDLIYSPKNLAAMVTERYPITPFVCDFKIIISESILANFLGLKHIAVSGLMPVVEGVGSRIAESRGVKFEKTYSGFKNLIKNFKGMVVEKKGGDVGELLSMLGSFEDFLTSGMYSFSKEYQYFDRANRHGVLHGDYSDGYYNNPMGFYKTIAAIDFLCFMSAYTENISWFAPSYTQRSLALANYYESVAGLADLSKWAKSDRPSLSSGQVPL